MSVVKSLLAALGRAPVLIVMEATGQYWKNPVFVLTTAGYDVALLHPLIARRFQETNLARTKTDALDASGLRLCGPASLPALRR